MYIWEGTCMPQHTYRDTGQLCGFWGSNAGKGTLYFLGDLHFITKTLIEVGGEK